MIFGSSWTVVVVKHCEGIAKEPAMEVDQRDFYDVRNLLLFQLLQPNAQRPMAIRSINEKIVNKAVMNKDGWATLMVC